MSNLIFFDLPYGSIIGKVIKLDNLIETIVPHLPEGFYYSLNSDSSYEKVLCSVMLDGQSYFVGIDGVPNTGAIMQVKKLTR